MDSERVQPSAGRAPVCAAEAPVDTEMIRDTIARSLNVDSRYSDMPGLRDLEALLRGHIGLLIGPVREGAGRLWHGEVEWYLRVSRLDAIERQLSERVCSHSRFACLAQVQRLARDCRWLFALYRAVER